MKNRYFLIVLFSLLLNNLCVSAQDITFADILANEKEQTIRIKKQAHSNSKSIKSTNYYSPLRTLDRTFFESYLSVVGHFGTNEVDLPDSYGYYTNETNVSVLGFGAEYEFGARLGQVFFLGAGVGVRSYKPTDSYYGWGLNMPLYANAKIYMLANYPFSLSADFGFGGAFSIKKTISTPSGIYLKVGLGMDIKCFYLAGGFEMMAKLSDPMSMGLTGYVKLGVIISK